MISEKELANEYGAAAGGLSATACSNALSALRAISRDQSAKDAVARIHHLNAYARRIQTSLEAGEDSFEKNHVNSANLEWANALVLMDALSVESRNILDNQMVRGAVELQNCGKVA